jgi:hypothetical protein
MPGGPFVGLPRSTPSGRDLPDVAREETDTASGRAYMHEIGRGRDGRSELNYAIYHDRYQRTADGWKFTERVYEVRYHDTSRLAGSPSRQP